MEQFLQQNGIWVVPIVTIILTIVIKISAKNESVNLSLADWFDFGFDLSISSMVVLLSNAHTSIVALWLMLLFFLLIMITTIIVNRVGWNKQEKKLNFAGIFLPDAMGIILLVVSTLYVGGMIK